jgi:NAD(P)H-dependent flavin oxidoreductase YrpB (nitropropane dioxygenase family)
VTLTERLGIDIPIILAPMGGAVGPELCAAVSNAGGLGLLPQWWDDADVMGAAASVRALTNKPFGINLNNQYAMDGKLEAAIAADIGIVSFFWGLKPALVRRARDAGMLVMQSIGNAAEARAAVDAGVDIVVAQGWEAGGHVWGEVATLALVPAVVDAVPETPVVAAGGIADGRGVAAVLALGAAAAWVGTRFILSEEATSDEAKRASIIAATEADTAIGKDTTESWKDSPIRWLGRQAERWSPEYGPQPRILVGQGVGLVRKVQPAADIVTEIWAEARAVMSGLSRYGGQRR